METEEKTYRLERFVKAQENVYPWALEEIRRGHKDNHWIWYIFPQHVELGRSWMAKKYGIEDLEEARQYLAHPVLGPRLREISGALLDLSTTDPVEVFGGIDSVKVRSCMTLFLCADPEEAVFRQVLEKFYGGSLDGKTLDLLEIPR